MTALASFLLTLIISSVYTIIVFYDLFHFSGKDMYSGLEYIGWAVAIFILTFLFIGGFTFFRVKKNRLIEIVKVLISGLIGISLPLITLFNIQQIETKKNIENARINQIDYYKSHNIHPDQILQQELGLLEKNRPITIMDSNNNFGPFLVKQNTPFQLTVLVRNDLIPDDGSIHYEVKGIIKNSIDRTILSEGYFHTEGEFSEDGRRIFRGEITIDDFSSISSFWLTIKVRENITETNGLLPSNEVEN